MTYQSPADLRTNTPGHISLVSVDQTNLNGNHGPRRTDPHGLCECPKADIVSALGECQRCFRLVGIWKPCPVMRDGEHPVEHDGAICWHCDTTGWVLR